MASSQSTVEHNEELRKIFTLQFKVNYKKTTAHLPVSRTIDKKQITAFAIQRLFHVEHRTLHLRANFCVNPRFETGVFWPVLKTPEGNLRFEPVPILAMDLDSRENAP